jgi:hypothetical protein
MMIFRKVRPSIRGISRSSVRTSGRSSMMRSRAAKGSAAVPTTSMPGSALRASVRILRTMAESSITRTRMGGVDIEGGGQAARR